MDEAKLPLVSEIFGVLGELVIGFGSGLVWIGFGLVWLVWLVRCDLFPLHRGVLRGGAAEHKHRKVVMNK